MELKHFPAVAGSDDVADLKSVRQLFVVRERLKADLEEIKEKLAETEGLIKGAMGQAGQGVIDGRVVLTRTVVNGTRFDKSGLGKAHPELVKEFTVPNPYSKYSFKDSA